MGASSRVRSARSSEDFLAGHAHPNIEARRALPFSKHGEEMMKRDEAEKKRAPANEIIKTTKREKMSNLILLLLLLLLVTIVPVFLCSLMNE